MKRFFIHTGAFKGESFYASSEKEVYNKPYQTCITFIDRCISVPANILIGVFFSEEPYVNYDQRIVYANDQPLHSVYIGLN